MKSKYMLLMLLPVLAMASGTEAEHEGGTDIFVRTINFLIFAGILYYLLADKIKSYFRGRSKAIADSLVAVQDKLAESKAQKEKALKKAESSVENAQQVIETAKKEAELLTNKIQENLKTEVAALEKSFAEKKEVEEKKMNKEVVNEVINEMFNEGGINISSDDLLDIVKKKVA